MIKFSKTEDYALILISVLAHSYEKKLVSLTYVSNEYHIPILFLRNLANILMHGGVIKAVEGKNGGYMLTRDPAVLTIGEVLQLLSKEAQYECCEISRENGVCVKTAVCQPTLTWRKINQEFADKISHLSVAEFQQQTTNS